MAVEKDNTHGLLALFRCFTCFVFCEYHITKINVCFVCIFQAKVAIRRGATAVVFDVSNVPEAAKKVGLMTDMY
jgi:hypothetical protein